MQHRTLHRSLALITVGALAAASCGSDDDTATTSPPASESTALSTTAPAEPTATTETGTGATVGTGAGGTVDLAAVCPETVVIQTDWFPEAEHGSLYELVGEGYVVDTDKKTVTGPLVAGGTDTGVKIELRTGGPAIGFNPVASTMYTDDTITLGYANTEGQVLQNAATPMISVMAPLEINPQIIMWDPATYPDVKTLADLGTNDITINIFGGGVFSEVFVAQGIWNADQVDPSYDGSPARFIAEDGKIAQQGFASAEPYSYESVFEDWGKPVAFQTLHDAGFEVYSQTLAVRAADMDTLAPCLDRLVPVVQHGAVDYINDADRANAIIIDAVAQFADFWVYDQGLADFSVKTQQELGLVGNGPDSTIGNMEEDRIQSVIDQMRDAGLDVPDDLTATDLFTNDFLDPDIGL